MARRTGDLEDTAAMSVGRLDRLSEAVSRIRGGRRLNADRVQLVAGAALAVIGLIAIGVGWYGAAHTGFTFEQTPYLISGGLLGLALCFLGGFVYFAYWVTRLVRESRAQSERATEILGQIAITLNGNGARPSARARRPIAGGSVGTFVATRKGTLFHRRDCPAVGGRDKLRKVTARTPGLQPCGICDPLGSD